jgi:3'-phosphoadenosine 5'-phosphosulfate sulfotransferase (PAPS reductase)/FAD synthetase
MNTDLLKRVIEPRLKGTFTLPTVKNPQNTLIHICGISGGIDSTATILCLKYLFPDTAFILVFTDTKFEAKGTLKAIDKLEKLLGQPVLRINAEHGLIEYIEKAGGYIPSFGSRFCTSSQKIIPMTRFMEKLRIQYSGKVEFAQYTGIRADEPTRDGAIYSGDIMNYFPLASLGLVKSDVNHIVQDINGIPSFYQNKSRSGCAICYQNRRSETIAAWQESPEQVQKAAKFEVMPDNIIQIFNGLPTPVSKETGVSRNWLGFVRPHWLGYEPMGYQSTKRGKNQRKETVDLFAEQAKHIYVAVEYSFYGGIPGMANAQVYFEQIISYSTSLTGIKKALKFFWLHRLQTKEILDIETTTLLEKTRQIAIIQLEVNDWESVVPPKPNETFTWSSDKKPLLAIRKTVKVIEHILLCEGLRQIHDPLINKVTKEYGRVLHFSQFHQPKLEDLLDDIDIEDAPVACNVCSR